MKSMTKIDMLYFLFWCFALSLFTSSPSYAEGAFDTNSCAQVAVKATSLSSKD